MRKPIIVGNWKMNCTIPEAFELVKRLKMMVSEVKGREIVIAPPFTALSSVSHALIGSNMTLAAQNLFWEGKGAFTGEISAEMILDSGCDYVIIGHSERRQFFAETDDSVNRKVKAALAGGLIPIVCVGETLAEREAGETFPVIERQLTNGLNDVRLSSSEDLVIAYEPVWAIGTGRTATPSQAQEVHAYIRGLLKNLLGEAAGDIRVLYGGSVKPENIDELMTEPDIDGALVGGASLKADSFARIVRFKVHGMAKDTEHYL
ncbi:MAG: triose-phosphate isomerase [Deltaproteobacteria bacterium]|nr:triose-phosphate isomerase [Deltaproteobacteria bacterium]